MKSKSYQTYQTLFENHLAFLSTHRGTVSSDGDSFQVESSRKEFTYAVPGSKKTECRLLDQFQALHLAPWSAVTEEELLNCGFKSQGGISYMELPKNTPIWELNPGIQVQRVTSEQDMAIFSEVQGRGFISNEEAYQDWQPWLHRFNLKNLHHSEQSFYVGYLDSKPIGCSLLVMTPEAAGIYAVATLPDFRKQGVSTTVMKTLIEATERYGRKRITLQVAQNSYAEKFYERLGFKTDFQVGIFTRA